MNKIAAGIGAALLLGLTQPGVAASQVTTIYETPAGEPSSVIPGAKGSVLVSVRRANSENGMVIELDPPASGQTGWTETTVFDFTKPAQGGDPTISPLSKDAIIGAAFVKGGASDCGTIFTLHTTPRGWRLKTIWKFRNYQ